MAEEKKESGGSHMSDVYFIVGVLVVLTAIWWARGGLHSAEQLNGLFLQPPQPIGTGESYGPTVEEVANQYYPQ